MKAKKTVFKVAPSFSHKIQTFVAKKLATANVEEFGFGTMKPSSSSSAQSSSDAIPSTAASSSDSSSDSMASPTPILNRNSTISSMFSFAYASSYSSVSCSSESYSDQASTRSSVWKGFTKVECRDAVTCNKCHRRLSHTSAAGTGTMWTHMKNCNVSLYNQLVLALRLSVFSPAFRDAWTVLVPCMLSACGTVPSSW